MGGNVPQRIVDVLVRRLFTVYPDGVVCKRKIHPFRALSDNKGISPPAGDDQGFAFGNHKLLKKLDQNFHKRASRELHYWDVCLKFLQSTSP